VRNVVVFLLLLAIKVASRVFYRHEVAWVGDVPPELWKSLRLVALLNHMKALGEGCDPDGFKRAVKDDLQRRRDLYCT